MSKDNSKNNEKKDLTIQRFKQKNREELFNKLKNWGFGFEHLTYKSDRCLKIGFILNEGLIGWTKSPPLKNGTILYLYIYMDRIDLVVDDEIVKTIPDWYEDIQKTFISISNEYEQYFYFTEEVLNYYPNVKKKYELENAIESIYPTIRIRSINTTEYFSVWAGAGEFTFLIERENNTDKITITTWYYGKGVSGYQKNRWNIPIKYRKILKSLNFKPVFDYDLGKLVKIYNKCKKLK